MSTLEYSEMTVELMEQRAQLRSALVQAICLIDDYKDVINGSDSLSNFSVAGTRHKAQVALAATAPKWD